MNLPPGFSVSLPGGVRNVTCDACGERIKDPFGQEDVEGWARGHVCDLDTTKDAPPRP